MNGAEVRGNEREKHARDTATLLLLRVRLVPAVQPLRPLPAVDRPGRARGALRPDTPADTPAPALPELEYVHGVVRRGHAEQRRDEVEVDRVYARLARAPAELVELLSPRDAPHADDGALVGRGGEERAGGVDGEEGDGRLVRLDDVRDRERARREEQHVARRGRCGR